MPSSASSRAVPPVDTSSTSSSASPRAKSTSARLSETLSSARRMRTSPGAVSSVPRGSIDIVDQHDAGVDGVAANPSVGNEANGTRQQPVLHTMHALLDLGNGRRIRKLQALLKQDRPAVDALVHEMHGHSGDLDAVLDRLLDRADPREGRKQRRV